MESRKVGVRELRQNLSKYLRRVERGERLEVTEHGRPVAVLAPLPAADRPITRLVASGRLSAPDGELLALLPPRGRPTSRVSRALQEGREDRV
jgi:prevent-host-death family protein